MSRLTSALVEQPPERDLFDQYIPSNPFRSLADNIVPAVVLFSLLVGGGLMCAPDKSTRLPGLCIAAEALSRVTTFIVKLTPLGLFAIVASASGTSLHARPPPGQPGGHLLSQIGTIRAGESVVRAEETYPVTPAAPASEHGAPASVASTPARGRQRLSLSVLEPLEPCPLTSAPP